jgi:hypothetical protein
MAYTYAELLACAERELRLRNKVYARWPVSDQHTAKREIELMEEIAAILRALDECQARLEYHDGRLPPTPSLPIFVPQKS